MLWNDEDLVKFFGNFESVDPCDEDDLSAYESDDAPMDENIDDHPKECNNTLDPTKCVVCRLRKSTFVTSCGHFACDQCWSDWLDKENERLDKSNEPAYAIKFNKKFPQCLHCETRVQYTTKIHFPS